MQVIETEANSKFHNIENRSSIYDFFLLMKPRVMSLVVFTAFVGMVLSPEKIHPFLMFFSLLSIAIGAGASGAFNQCIDKNIDKIMLRTRQRPIASGKIEVSDALTFASVFSVFSIILLGLSSNWTAAFLLAFTIFFYVVIYSLWLKHLTSQNIVIGGAAGAFPPIIGWISTGSDITFTPIFLFLIIFLWTPPHFWALAISIKEDYRKAKVPMLPVVASDKNTRVQILIYSLILFSVCIVPSYLGFFGKVYFFGSLICNSIFSLICLYFLLRPSKSNSMKVFTISIMFLFSIFSLLLLDHFILN